jgi:CO/xanthine dehydrogenase Mo-binding subunit
MRDSSSATMNFPIDQKQPGMLHAALLRAEVASARILRVNCSAARKMPGVRAIVTAADAPGRYGIGVADHPLFATECIRYDGEPIAAVAAETLAQARAAAAAIIVELETLPAVLSMADALAPNAHLVHPVAGLRGYAGMRRARRQRGLGSDRRARRRRCGVLPPGRSNSRKHLSGRATKSSFA